jgi:cyclopropane fatty-acyl-phospholipid synthase-like methyltransferase
LQPGDFHYRAFVGPPEKYDIVGASQFNLLTLLGLREHHTLLDVGCGSLRAGRLFIPYLLPGNYHGIEPEPWLVEEGIQQELGADIIRIKKPLISHRSDFKLSSFGVHFDFILAQSIFSHACLSQIQTCLGEAASCMAPRGLFAATYFLGPDDSAETSWTYPGCVFYTDASMKRWAAEAGLGCIRLGWRHPNGQTWMLLYHASRPAPEVEALFTIGLMLNPLASDDPK